MPIFVGEIVFIVLNNYIMKKVLSLITLLFCAITLSAQETATIDGIKYYLENGKATIMVQPTTLSGDIVIPEKVTYNNVDYTVSSMTSSAFKQTDIKTITLPNSITSLGDECFWFCSYLTSIILPNSITSLGNDCFGSCSNLTSIILPNRIISLGNGCFSSCGLTSITFPNSIASLGNGCFNCCSNLTSIILPNSITSLGDLCFWNCSSLTSITLPNSITSLGYNCFGLCTNLTSITLPNSITSLGNSCFDSCTNLTSITLPNSITSLGNGCFKNCSNLFKVTCQWDNLNNVSTESNAFDNIFSEAKLYVPTGTTAIYKAKAPWSNFKYIVEDGGTTPTTKQCATPTISYTDKKLLFASTTTGAQYHYTITDDDVKTDAYSENGTISLTATYNISAYATADGYTNSEKATAKLYFISANLGDVNGIASAKQRGIIVQNNNDFITISGLNDNESVSLYNVSGIELGNTKATSGTATFNVNKADEVVIVKIGNSSIKVAVK